MKDQVKKNKDGVWKNNKDVRSLEDKIEQLQINVRSNQIDIKSNHGAIEHLQRLIANLSGAKFEPLPPLHHDEKVGPLQSRGGDEALKKSVDSMQLRLLALEKNDTYQDQHIGTHTKQIDDLTKSIRSFTNKLNQIMSKSDEPVDSRTPVPMVTMSTPDDQTEELRNKLLLLEGKLKNLQDKKCDVDKHDMEVFRINQRLEKLEAKKVGNVRNPAESAPLEAPAGSTMDPAILDQINQRLEETSQVVLQNREVVAGQVE